MADTKAESPEHPRALEYGHPSRWISSRRAKRTVTAIILLSLAVAAYRPARPVIARLAENWTWYQVQRDCAGLELPTEALIWQEAVRTGTNNVPVRNGPYGNRTTYLYVEHGKPDEVLMCRDDLSVTVRGVPFWDTFRDNGLDRDEGVGPFQKWPNGIAAVRPSPVQALLPTDDGVAYLHARRSPSGHTRLVCVGITWVGPQLSTHVIVPGSVFSMPRWAGTNVQMAILRPTLNDRVEVLAGCSDPNHESHFWITARLSGHPFVLDGNLGDDDFVHYTARAGQLYAVDCMPMWYLSNERWDPKHWWPPPSSEKARRSLSVPEDY